MLSSPPHCGLSLQTLTILMDLARTTVLAQIEGDFKYKATFIFQRIRRKVSKFFTHTRKKKKRPPPPAPASKALPSHDGLTPAQLLIQGLLSTGPEPIVPVERIHGCIHGLVEQMGRKGGQTDYFPASPPSNTVDHHHLPFFKPLNGTGPRCCVRQAGRFTRLST